MKILCVDDDEIALDILEAALISDGHEVIRAADGAEALRVLRNESVPMVISDWMMPGITGLELAACVRDLHATNYTYFILLTSRTDKADLLAGLNAGADDFIVKPFDPVELTLRVKVAQRVLALETHNLTIFTLAQLADTRDNETGMHLNRIREYSRLMAERIMSMPEIGPSLPSDYPELIYLTSPLHDIGKVGIPDCVLLKPGHLDDQEYLVMKTHALLGAQTLSAALEQYPDVEYLKMARDIALYHHERYDGQGYPSGVAGSDIPLCARIVSIADVYDALIVRRVYKQAFSHEIACSVITEGRGTQFDPMVVDAFMAREQGFREIASRYADLPYMEMELKKCA